MNAGFEMSGWVFALTVFAFQVFAPTITSFSIVHRHSSSGRKLFGGYRIVPKTCVSTIKDGPKTGVCMFNYECTRRGGYLIGSCVDGFLFGACCSLSESELLALASLQNEDIKSTDVTNNLLVNSGNSPDTVYVNTVHPTSPSKTSATTQRGGAILTPHRTTGVFINNVYTVPQNNPIITTTTSTADESMEHDSTKPLLEQYLNNQHGGYIDNSGFLPVDKYPGADTILLNPDGTIVEDNYDPEIEFAIPEEKQPIYAPSVFDTFKKSTPSIIQAITESPMNLVTFTYVSKDGQQMTSPTPQTTLPDDMEMENTFSKLSTTLPKQPLTSFSGEQATTVSLFYKHTVSHPPDDLVLVPTIEHKNEIKTVRPKPTEEEWNKFYGYNTTAVQNQVGLLDGDSSSINHIITLLHENEPKPEPEPIAVTGQPVAQNGLSTWVSVQDKPWKKTTPTPNKKPGTSGVFNVHGPSLTISGSDINLAPTVVVIPPPIEHATTVSSVSVPLITRLSSKRPQIVTQAQSENQQTGFYLTQKPSLVVVTATSGPGQEPHINFPPVRNPDLNTSSLNQVEKPTIVQSGSQTSGSTLPNGLITTLDVIDDPEINTIDPDEDYDDLTTPELVDEKVGDKVHTFVEKIVNSLAGNFQDLENVLFKNENATKIANENGIELNNVHIGDSTDPPKRVTSTTEPTTTKRPLKTTVTTLAPPNTTKRTQTKKPTTITTTTKRPIVQFGTTTKKPVKTQTTTRRPTAATTTKKPTPTTTKKSVTKRPKPTTPAAATTSTTTTTTTTTKKPKTTTPLEYDEVTEPDENEISTLLSQADFDGETYDFRKECGVRPLISKTKNGRIVGGKGSEFGSYPWQVLVRESTWLGLFTKNKCGGVLITNRYVITAAHCQPGFLASLVAVFGEFDISGELESKRSLSKNVRRVIVHRQYDPATFENDLAVLELDSPIQFDVHIVPICMPKEGEDFVGRMATVTGWGRLKYGGGVPSVLQEVSVPLIENSVCQEMFQTAGHQKRILSSFLCAGYANGQRDSCEGDSGGPLMVEREDGHWALLGTVSHGIKCAAPYLPGVYMRTSYYKPWLKSVTGVAT